MDCIFCKIVNGEIPAKTLVQTEHSLAFMDAFPLTPGHSLVIPKTHREKIQDMTEQENADLFETARKLISKVDSLTGATLLAVHNGKESGQEIPHVHIHLIPRSSKDGAGAVHSMFEPIEKLSDEQINELHSKLKD